MVNSTAIYCTLTLHEQRARRSEVTAKLVPQVAAVISIANGLRLDFEPSEGLRDLIEEFVEFERDCCSFLTFTLSQPADDLSLLIQGPSNAAHIVEMFRRTALGENQ